MTHRRNGDADAGCAQSAVDPQIVGGAWRTSADSTTIEDVFDEFQRLDDAGLLAAMSESLRVERAAAARRLVAAGALAVRREAGPGTKTEMWCVEDWDVAAAEVGAELGLSRFRASGDMALGHTLVTRLPRVAHRFLAGDFDVRVATAIDNRTTLVQDPDILVSLDETLARNAAGWNGLSREKLNDVIDWLVVELDPEARRVARERNEDRHIDIASGRRGLSDVSGRLPAVDADILDTRLDQLADTVCRDDPRTKAQRRVDALVARVDGRALSCECGSDDCPTAAAMDDTGDAADGTGDASAPPAQVIVHVLAEQATVTGQSDKPGYLPGQGAIPAETVRELVDSGRARTRPVADAEALTAEPRYRPSRKLTDFLLCRDLICRFPGCDHPAQRCDTDHTVAWPRGRTHPSNTKSYCRHHHLLKTFWTGPGGWRDTQHPDGTVEFTSPSGRKYRTKPLGALFFPQLATPTGAHVPRGEPPPESELRGASMPLRRRSRAADRAARIAAERKVNRARIAAHPPPPF